jgi:DNA-binding NarL/FixJ family response regulator
MAEGSDIRVLIADDHPVFRDGLAAIIDHECDMAVAAVVGDGKQALESYRSLRPDVMLLDLRMPVMDGLTALKKILAECSAARILVLTAFDDDQAVYTAIQVGARGYLLKEAAGAEIVDAIRSVHAGLRRIPERVAACLANHVARSQLSSRETEVLRLLCRGCTNQQIAAELHLAEPTVKGHVHHILNKLGAEDRTQAVIVALKRGIVRLD